MYIHDLSVNRIYTDGKGRWRMIDNFFDDFDGGRRVQYVKGYFNLSGDWKIFGTVESCDKGTFARWAKSKVSK